MCLTSILNTVYVKIKILTALLEIINLYERFIRKYQSGALHQMQHAGSLVTYNTNYSCIYAFTITPCIAATSHIFTDCIPLIDCSEYSYLRLSIMKDNQNVTVFTLICSILSKQSFEWVKYLQSNYTCMIRS